MFLGFGGITAALKTICVVYYAVMIPHHAADLRAFMSTFSMPSFSWPSNGTPYVFDDEHNFYWLTQFVCPDDKDGVNPCDVDIYAFMRDIKPLNSVTVVPMEMSAKEFEQKVRYVAEIGRLNGYGYGLIVGFACGPAFILLCYGLLNLTEYVYDRFVNLVQYVSDRLGDLVAE